MKWLTFILSFVVALNVCRIAINPQNDNLSFTGIVSYLSKNFTFNYEETASQIKVIKQDFDSLKEGHKYLSSSELQWNSNELLKSFGDTLSIKEFFQYMKWIFEVGLESVKTFFERVFGGVALIADILFILGTLVIDTVDNIYELSYLFLYLLGFNVSI